LLVGNGEQESDLKHQCSLLDNKIKERIIFLDFVNQNEMPFIYHASDVFVLPSFSETWGLSVNEAMAAGKAVIVSDNCGCSPDLVIDEKNGYVFINNNVDSLTSSLKKIIYKKDLDHLWGLKLD